MVPETGVGQGVGNHEGFLLQQRVHAGRVAQWKLAHVQADLGFEPFALVVDEVERGDGRAAQTRGEAAEIVEVPFPGGVEDAIALEGGDARRFVVCGGSTVHEREVIKYGLALGREFSLALGESVLSHPLPNPWIPRSGATGSNTTEMPGTRAAS